MWRICLVDVIYVVKREHLILEDVGLFQRKPELIDTYPSIYVELSKLYELYAQVVITSHKNPSITREQILVQVRKQHLYPGCLCASSLPESIDVVTTLRCQHAVGHKQEFD